MKNKTLPQAKPSLGPAISPGELSASVPVKLSTEQSKMLSDLKNASGLSRSAIIRLGLNYFLPRFKSGKIDIHDCIRADGSLNGKIA